MMVEEGAVVMSVPVQKVRESVKQKVKIDPPVNLVCDDRVKKWAWENGYMLLFIFCMFLITWVFMVTASVLVAHYA